MSHIYPAHTTKSYLSETDSSTHVCFVFLVVSFRLAFPPITYMHCSSPDSCYISFPFHTTRLEHSSYTWRRVQIAKLLVMQFSSTSCHFISLWSKYSPQHPVIKHLSVFSSLNVEKQISHHFTTIGKIIILFIPIFKFLDRKLEGKRFWTEGIKHCPNLIPY
jgi:hypothetical protein